MSIYVWTSEIKNIYVWTTPVKEVYVWTTKVRPSRWTWDTTWLTLSSSKSISSSMRGSYMTNDGKYLYCWIESWSAVWWYEMSTPYDLSTATQKWTLSTWVSTNWVTIDETWTYLYIVWYSAGLRQYVLSTPFNVTTATLNASISSINWETWRRCVQIKDDTHIYISTWAYKQSMINLNSAHNLSSYTFTNYTATTNQRSVFNHSWDKILYCTSESSSTTMYSWNVATAWNPSSTISWATSRLSWLRYPRWSYTNYDRWLMVGAENGYVYYYSLPNS